MKAQTRIDLYKLHKADYLAPKVPTLVTLKPANYLGIAGKGAPGGDRFTASIQALYGVAYTIKMTRKFAGLEDYAVCKLEGQWWEEGGTRNFAQIPKDQWCWKLLIRTPDFIGERDLSQATHKLLERGKSEEVKQVRLEIIDEGACVQMLHTGPYDRECETISQMVAFAKERQFRLHGLHHEIYLSDPRRVAPEKLKTILRMPVVRA